MHLSGDSETKPASLLEVWEHAQRNRKGFRFSDVSGIWGFLGFFGFLLACALLGDIVRGRVSPYLWVQVQTEASKHGGGSAAFLCVWYLGLYSCFVLIPYAISGWVNDAPNLRSRRLVLGLWFLATALVFAESIRSFLAHLPSDIFNGWLLIGWCGFSYYAVRGVWLLVASKLHLERPKTR